MKTISKVVEEFEQDEQRRQMLCDARKLLNDEFLSKTGSIEFMLNCFQAHLREEKEKYERIIDRLYKKQELHKDKLLILLDVIFKIDVGDSVVECLKSNTYTDREEAQKSLIEYLE